MHYRVKYSSSTEFVLRYIERCAAKCGTIDILEWIYELEGDSRLELLFGPSKTPKIREVEDDETLEPFGGIPAKIPGIKGDFAVQSCEAAAEANQVLVLEYLFEKYCLMHTDLENFNNLITIAAGKGHLQCITFLCENGCSGNERDQIYDCQSAARHGQLECLRYLKEQGWPVDGSVIFEAAEAGHLHCIEYLRSVGCPWNAIDVGDDDFHAGDIMEACAGSSLECLRYCHENGCNVDLFLSCVQAAKNGKVDCIEYLRSKGCPWAMDFTEAAAGNDQLDSLEYLHKSGCPWNQMACLKAVHGDASRCLQYLHENRCEWDPDFLILEALRYGKLDCLKYLLHVGTVLPNNYDSILLQGETVEGGANLPRISLLPKFLTTHMDCIQYLIETGYHSRDLILKAIDHGLAQTLQHLSSEEIKNDTTIAGYAANHGQLECLASLHGNGFRWDESSYAGYLRENKSPMPTHIRCLQYMNEHQLETNEIALLNTIRAGHVYCVDLLIKDAWKSDDKFCMEAIRNRKYTCFKLLIERGFAFDPKLCAIEAARLGSVACLEYIHINGFALPKEALDAAESHDSKFCVEYIKQHSQCQCHNETSRKRNANDAKLDHL
ncbi:hypothetical protein CTEN210_00684 [Chaetoceros tenuissimus]|uniref:Uncharacterized protein n=1 Tax=Chaetoceros tenuissimus TaxID=426638 RepID=A0AAD3GZ18_9STRA|nr:hypothetical protein CTEN210_00684 [Chaetoceros tenuissimus]